MTPDCAASYHSALSLPGLARVPGVTSTLEEPDENHRPLHYRPVCRGSARPCPGGECYPGSGYQFVRPLRIDHYRKNGVPLSETEGLAFAHQSLFARFYETELESHAQCELFAGGSHAG